MYSLIYSSPPLFDLNPSTTDLFFKNTPNPIFLFYDSFYDSNFYKIWQNISIHDYYPYNNTYKIGILDCDKYYSECQRWSFRNTISTPFAYFYSRKTNNFEYNERKSLNMKDIESFMQNAEILPPIHTPSPVPIPEQPLISIGWTDRPIEIESDYKLIENTNLKERTVDQIATIYNRVYHPIRIPTYSNVNRECLDLEPNETDHTNSLNLINFFRWLAGLSYFVTQNEKWTNLSKRASFAAQKHGSLDRDMSSYTLCSDNDIAKVFNNGLLISDTESCFDSVLEMFKRSDKDSLFCRSWLLDANLEQIGFGFTPKNYRDNVIYGDSKAVFQITEDKDLLSFYPLNVTNDLNFISWPPHGFFPINKVPKIFHISYPNFINYRLTDLEVNIVRDDGTNLQTSEISLVPNSHDKSTLYIELLDKSVELCQELYAITVSVKNAREKEHILYTIDFFNHTEIVDICFYNTNENKCPEKVIKKRRYGKGQYNNDQIWNNGPAVRIHVVEKIELNEGLIFTNQQKVRIIGNPIKGQISIYSTAFIEFDNPTESDIIYYWSVKNETIGYVSAKLPPKLIKINIIEEYENKHFNLNFYHGRNIPMVLSKFINNGIDYDAFYSIYQDGLDFYVKVISESTTDVFSDYSIIDKNYLSKQSSSKRIIKVFNQSLRLTNNSIFQDNRKRDYEFYISNSLDFICYSDYYNKLCNSILLTIYGNANSFKLNIISVDSDDRDRCNINNLTIKGAEIVSNRYYFSKMNDYFSSFHNDFYDEIKINSNIIEAHLSFQKTHCIIETHYKYEDFEIYFSIENKYKSITVHPKIGKESIPVKLSFKNNLNPNEVVPNHRYSIPSLYFENYKSVVITNQLYSVFNNVIYTYHKYFNFSNCSSIEFTNQPSYQAAVFVNYSVSFIGGSNCLINFGHLTVFSKFSIQKEGKYTFKNTQINNLIVKSRQEYVDVKLGNITVNSTSLILTRCSFIDDQSIITLIRSNVNSSWPLIILNGTDFKPKEINVRYPYHSTSYYCRHIIISGLKNCNSIIENVNNYYANCSKDGKYLQIQEGQYSEDIDLTQIKYITSTPSPPPSQPQFSTQTPYSQTALPTNLTVDSNERSAKKKKLSAGAIAGIVIGVIAFVVLILLVSFFIMKKQKVFANLSSE